MERIRRTPVHPIVEGVGRALAEIGGKALRRAADSVMEDGQRAAEDLRHDIMNARSRVGGDVIDVPFEVRQVTPEDDMERVERRRRGAREDKDPEDKDDPPPPSGDVAEIEELQNMRDAETFLRHGWMLLADLADSGAYPKENAGELDELLGDLRDRIEERDGV